MPLHASIYSGFEIKKRNFVISATTNLEVS